MNYWVALKRNDQVLIPQCRVATTFFSRFLGLMGKSTIPTTEAVIFPRCNSIHMFFMRFAIDVVFVDDEGMAKKVFHGLKPWRMVMPVKNAKHAIEMAEGLAMKLKIEEGQKLQCPEVWNRPV